MKQLIRLRDGQNREADVNGLSPDGQSGSAYLIPAGTYQSLAAYLQAGHEIAVQRLPDGSWQEQYAGDTSFFFPDPGLHDKLQP